MKIEVIVRFKTDKAIKVTCRGTDVWLPRSQIILPPYAIGEPVEIEVVEWIAKKNGWLEYDNYEDHDSYLLDDHLDKKIFLTGTWINKCDN